MPLPYPQPLPPKNTPTLGPVTPLTIGGGGLGLVWGKTTREEAVLTLQRAVHHHGINLLDMAPMYGRNREAEHTVGRAFQGNLPPGVQVLTKVYCGNRSAKDIPTKVRASLEKSLNAMRLTKVSILICHSNLVPDDWVAPTATQDRHGTRWSAYVHGFIPVCQALVKEGKIDSWGITGVGQPATIIRALHHDPRPAVVEVISNGGDYVGELKLFRGDARCREIIQVAQAHQVTVLGIRAVGAGSLCDVIDRVLAPDHPVLVQWQQAQRFRGIAKENGMSAACLAHRYAVGMEGVHSVVLGVKNRQELDECCAAAREGALGVQLQRDIEAALRTAGTGTIVVQRKLLGPLAKL